MSKAELLCIYCFGMCIFFLSSPGFATQATAKKEKKIHVYSYSEDLTLENLKDRVQTHELSTHSLAHKKELPVYAIRTEWLSKVGNQDWFQDWDQLEKDLFLLRCKNYELDQLKDFYPQISERAFLQVKHLFADWEKHE